MNSKLIMIEGIPGSGKTTTAKKVSELLTSINVKNQLFLEGNANHPADYESTACLSEDHYNSLLEKYSEGKDIIESYVTKKKSFSFIPYGKMSTEAVGLPEALLQELGSNDVYNLPLETYCDVILERWEEFAEKAKNDDTVYIFECAFLQNPLCVLTARDDRPYPEISDFYSKFTEILTSLNPVLITINQSNTEETIDRIRKERSQDWFDFITWYYTQQSFGKNRGLNGYDGVIAYLDYRKETEALLLASFPFSKLHYDNSSYDWDKMSTEIERFIKEYM
ncbi:hypothetical protein [Fredinandcohnia sp. 179-A 10B2 NHS]|uniref:hypothetical protein n=1 Tax=Fredinandcohnia sp. 179-A 10B2 NHS TaxID=3235176 RepID=UPI0039A0632C